MKIKKQKLLALILLFIFSFNFFLPYEAYAKIRLKNLFRSIRRGTRFVINLPDKATRWMGPVLGPLASDILTQNIGRNPRFGQIFRNLRKGEKTIQDIEKQKQALAEIRKTYRDQASDLRQKADEIRESRRNFTSQVTSADMTFDDYKDKVADLDKIAQTYEAAADKIDSIADRIKAQDLIRMLGNNFVRQTLNQIKDTVVYQLNNEIKRLINPDIIKTLISQDGPGLDNLLDLLISGDISRILNQSDDKNIDLDELRQKIKDEIKNTYKNNKDEFKNNWQQKLDEIIKNMIKEIEETKKNLEEVDTQKPESSDQPEEDTDSEQTEFIDDPNDKCPSGYAYKPRYGVDCVQINCEEGKIPNAHLSYTGDCVCGSSGSINENPEDPNKECSYGSDNKSCPGCVYACVGLKDECPKKP